jgi:hypothetical protein
MRIHGLEWSPFPRSRCPSGVGEMEQPVTTDPHRPLSAAEVQALHRRVLAARDLDVEPDPSDLATAHQLNADELAQFDRNSGGQR